MYPSLSLCWQDIWLLFLPGTPTLYILCPWLILGSLQSTFTPNLTMCLIFVESMVSSWQNG
uniref:Uncharacterized protein n=1 Tax=Octopus bimaculoides TaxID=37653 RepID=A0A0L8GNM8_OCTBM